MRVKCLAQEHNAVPRPGFEPGPLDPESSALTIRPLDPESSALTIRPPWGVGGGGGEGSHRACRLRLTSPYIFDVEHQCYCQLTAVKTRFTLTSDT